MSNVIVEGFGTYGTGAASGATDTVSLAMLAGAWAQAATDSSTGLGSLPWDSAAPDIFLYSSYDSFGTAYRDGWRRVLPEALSTVMVSFQYAVSELPESSGYTFLELRDDANNAICGLGITTTGGLFVYGSSHDTSLAATSGPVISAEAVQHIECKVTPATGEFVVYVAGTKVIDASGLTFASTDDVAQFTVLNVYSGAADARQYIGSLIVRDTAGSYNNTFPIGDRRVATLVVASDDAANQGWTAQPLHKFGAGILDLTASSACVYAEATTDTDIGANEFTFEGQFRFQNLPTGANKATLFSKWDGDANKRSYELYLGGPDLDNGLLVYRTSTDGTDSTSQDRGKWQWQPEVGHWYHVAMVRSADKLMLFIDGVLQGIAIDDDDTYYAGTARAAIGAEMDGTSVEPDTSLDGWVDEFRLTVGNARYTANFTPPTAAFPRNSSDAQWGSVKWLSSFDNAVVADDGPLTLALSVRGTGTAAITPGDGAHAYEVLNKTTPDDDTFLEAALIAAAGEFTMTDLPTAAETVTVGTTDGTTAAVYTWVSALAAAYDVLIGANLAACAANLSAAINAGDGEGTTYGTDTVANADVSSATNPANQVVATALTPGTSGNSIASTETCTKAAWGGTTLSGGQNIPDNSQFGFSRMPPNTVTVDSITLVGRQWKTDSGSGSTKLSFVGGDGGVAAGTANVLGTAPNLTFDTIEEDPDTSAGLTTASILLGKVRVERTA